jgi:Na+/H+ antiporter
VHQRIVAPDGWPGDEIIVLVHTALTLLALAAAVLAVTALADRIRFSAPLLLMLVGIVASFVPGIPALELHPEVILLGFLPPLLYATAIRTSVLDFHSHRRAIAFLSILLVVFTALGVGLVAWLLLPGIAFPVAFALGAVVAPPDAVAATAIARRVGLPRRVITILEGESLLNDATAITCLRVALVAVSGTVSAGGVALGFVVAAFGGLVVGLAVAAVAVAIRKRIHQPVFDTAISFVLPFAAYLPAERIVFQSFHGSGVIAVVTTALVLGHKSPFIQNGQSRISERINWSTIQFLLENTVFLLIGLQAKRLVTQMGESELSAGRITGFCLGVLGAVIVLRMAWVAASRFFLFGGRRSGQPPPWSHTIVVGWAGLRGVVTLAAAFLIPEDVPDRNLLIFAAMVVTAGTLLLQGLTLPALVRRLGLRGPDPRADALQAATVVQTAANAAIARLEDMASEVDEPAILDVVRARVASRSDSLWEQLGRRDGSETPSEGYRRLRLATLEAERGEVLKIRNTGKVAHEVIDEVLSTLDIEESMLTIAVQRSERLLDEESVPGPALVAETCEHLDDSTPDLETSGTGECEDCVREGTRPVHLRLCLTCGNVGCCDSSVGRHAERHFARTGHPVMESYEPGETWRWCYLDERVG